MAESKKTGPGPVSDQIARTIRRVREGQSITYTELVKRLEDLGRPIPILGLRRIERGERRVDVDDLVAIAAALRVPPVWLIFPLDSAAEPDIELLPDVRVPMEPALSWFIGDRAAFKDYFGRGNYKAHSRLFEWYELPEGISTNWGDSDRPLWLYRQHRRYVLEWYEIWEQGSRAQEQASKPAGALVFTLAALIEENLRTVRDEMRRLGLPLPYLPPSSLSDRLAPEQRGDDGKED